MLEEKIRIIRLILPKKFGVVCIKIQGLSSQRAIDEFSIYKHTGETELGSQSSVGAHVGKGDPDLLRRGEQAAKDAIIVKGQKQSSQCLGPVISLVPIIDPAPLAD